MMPSLKLASQASHKPVTNKSLPVIAARTIKPTKTHQPQPSITLMRKGLAKPTAKEHVKQVQPILNQLSSKLTGPYEKLHRHEVRLKQDVQQDFRISHFGKKALTTDNFSIKYQPLPVKLPHDGVSVETIDSDIAIKKTLPAETNEHRQSVKAHYKKQVKSHRFRRRFFIATVIIIVLIILGYLIYLLTPTIDVKVAAIHAGIPAQLPSYQPVDYVFKTPVRYGAGIVSIGYNRLYIFLKPTSHTLE
jgi:hypothetical protein